MANIDPRMILALRRIREGTLIYGENTGQKSLLGLYCKELRLPEELGDPEQIDPIPCRVRTLYLPQLDFAFKILTIQKLVHGGWTDSCELHAVWRFWGSWKTAFLMYFPINLVARLRRPNLRTAILHSVRSSSFLGLFVALFYYAVCLTRTRLGPLLFPKVSPMVWDNQLVVKVGCILCGWSVLIESRMRRAEMSFFVAPRALGVFLPGKYPREVCPMFSFYSSNLLNFLTVLQFQWRETLAFALSFAVVMTAIRDNKTLVRGVFGRLLSRIMA